MKELITLVAQQTEDLQKTKKELTEQLNNMAQAVLDVVLEDLQELSTADMHTYGRYIFSRASNMFDKHIASLTTVDTRTTLVGKRV